MYQLHDKHFEDMEMFFKNVAAAGNAPIAIVYQAACFVEIMANARRGYRQPENTPTSGPVKVPDAPAGGC